MADESPPGEILLHVTAMPALIEKAKDTSFRI